MAPRSPLADVPPDKFVEARNELARKLRERGDGEEARRVAALRRPSVALFIVNQLAQRDGEAVDALIDATARARRAQLHGGSADALRDAMKEQRDALHRLLEQAERVAHDIGTQLTPELRRRVQDTLQSAATSEAAALREGTLEHELSAAGFGAVLEGPKPSGAQARAAAAKATAHARTAVAAVAERASAAAGRADTHRQALKAKTEERKREMAASRERMLRKRELAQAEQAARRLDGRARQLELRARQTAEAASRAKTEAEEVRREATTAAARAAELRRSAQGSKE
jgi:hypothetical protein